jgi:hypothetical protein
MTGFKVIANQSRLDFSWDILYLVLIVIMGAEVICKSACCFFSGYVGFSRDEADVIYKGFFFSHLLEIRTMKFTHIIL